MNLTKKAFKKAYSQARDKGFHNVVYESIKIREAVSYATFNLNDRYIDFLWFQLRILEEAFQNKFYALNEDRNPFDMISKNRYDDEGRYARYNNEGRKLNTKYKNN